jgi:hypothetical protein
MITLEQVKKAAEAVVTPEDVRRLVWELEQKEPVLAASLANFVFVYQDSYPEGLRVKFQADAVSLALFYFLVFESRQIENLVSRN